MKVAVMQPYLFPYIGYWQLIGAVDKFVILDDVNFIKRGYINRNSILINHKPFMFSVPIKSASQNRLIMNTKLNFDERDRQIFLARIENTYKKALMFEKVMPYIERIIKNENDDLTDFIEYSLREIMSYLNIHTFLLRSSQIDKDNSLSASKRIVEICRRLNAEVYINPSGGRNLYRAEEFAKDNIKLYFLDTRFNKVEYKQFNDEFASNLSIIDILMFNKVREIQGMLKEYDLNE